MLNLETIIDCQSPCQFSGTELLPSLKLTSSFLNSGWLEYEFLILVSFPFGSLSICRGVLLLVSGGVLLYLFAPSLVFSEGFSPHVEMHVVDTFFGALAKLPQIS